MSGKTVNEAGNVGGSVTVGLPKGFTYFVRDGDMIKIGSSMRPQGRVGALQTGSSRPLEVLAIVSQGIADEFGTHQRFAHLRERGEWFRAESDLLDFIAGLPTPESTGAMAALKAKAEVQHSPRFVDKPIDIRRSLAAKRKAAGADTPIGHTCSNIVEILDSLSEYERPTWATDARQTLPWLMNRQIERLAALKVAQN